MITVVFVEYGIGFGGSVVSLSETVRAVKARGSVRPVVLTSQPPEVLQGLFEGIPHRYFRRALTYRSRQALAGWLKARVRFDAVSRVVLKLYAVADHILELYNSIRLCVVLRRTGASILHVNNGWRPEAVRAARWASVPCIIHCRGFAHESLVDLKANSLQRSPVRRFIAISKAVSADMASSGVPQGLLTVIYNPIDRHKYALGAQARDRLRSAYGYGNSDVVVAIFGRITPWKGQLEFLEAVVLVVDDCPRLRVLIVGDESDGADAEYSATLHRLADEKLAGRVTFAGFQSAVHEYYWAADIVVHNSQESEPFGRVVSEAMACERAVIAIDEGGPAEIITSSVDGVLVAPRDTRELAGALRLLYSDPALRESLGSRAAATILRRFSDSTIAREVATIYEETLSKAQPMELIPVIGEPSSRFNE